MEEMFTTILMAALAAHSLAVFIVNLTPTPKDDAAIKSIYRVIEMMAGLVTDKAKDE